MVPSEEKRREIQKSLKRIYAVILVLPVLALTFGGGVHILAVLLLLVPYVWWERRVIRGLKVYDGAVTR